jgi:colicin import membrane protein
VPDPEVNRAAEKLAAEKVAAEKTAAEKAAAEKAEAERAVAEKAAAAKEAAEKLAISQQQARERELRERLAAEERRVALSASAAQWQQALRAHIERQWRRPPSAAAGLRCVVWVDQVSGGEVVSVRMGECNGDEAVRQSIESAVYRASPLPPPPDPALFERRLELIFAPND